MQNGSTLTFSWLQHSLCSQSCCMRQTLEPQAHQMTSILGVVLLCEAGCNATLGKHSASEVPLLTAWIPHLQQRLPSMVFLHHLLQPVARSAKHPVAPRSVASSGPCQSESCGKMVRCLKKHCSTTCVEQARLLAPMCPQENQAPVGQQQPIARR